MSNRDRAWTAEQLENLASRMDAFPDDLPSVHDCIESSEAIRAFAATLRQPEGATVPPMRYWGLRNPPNWLDSDASENAQPAERATVPAVNGRRFVAWMIDNREGCRVTEEGLHGWLAEFLREESAAPSQPAEGE